MKKFKEKPLEKVKRFSMRLEVIKPLVLIASIGLTVGFHNASFQEQPRVLELNLHIGDEYCQDWDLSADQILYFLKSFDTLTSYDRNMCYGVFNCEVNGTILVENKIYQYSVNAGGWLRIKIGSEEKYLGSNSPKDSLFFISVNYCGENWDK